MSDILRAREDLRLGRFESAAYNAERLLAGEPENPAAVEVLAQALLSAGEARRALHRLERYRTRLPLEETVFIRLIEARCLAELRLYEDQVAIFEERGLPSTTGERDAARGNANPLIAAYYVLVGDAYEALENPQKASECYIAALQADESCVEALERLFYSNAVVASVPLGALPPSTSSGAQHKALSVDQIALQALWPFETPFPKDSSPSKVYLMLANDLRFDDWRKRWSLVPCFFLTMVATRFWRLGFCQEAYRLVSFLVAERKELELKRSFPLFVALLAHHQDLITLFRYAHQLVQEFPRAAESWYAVGMYYFASGKYDASRAYFQKATLLNSNLAYVWVAYGHAFAAVDDSEQALAAYRTAMRLRPNDPTPLLHVGMEFARQNHLAIARNFFERAAAAAAAVVVAPVLTSSADSDADEDALANGIERSRPWNELGVLCYRDGEYAEAVAYFQKAARPLQAYKKAWSMRLGLDQRYRISDGEGFAPEKQAEAAVQRPVLQQSGIENSQSTSPDTNAPSATSVWCDPTSTFYGCQEARSLLATICSNLGHALIRLQAIDLAAEALEEALLVGHAVRLAPGCAGSDALARADTLSALGYVEHVRGSVQRAAQLYHEAARELALAGINGSTLLLDALLERAVDELAMQSISEIATTE